MGISRSIRALAVPYLLALRIGDEFQLERVSARILERFGKKKPVTAVYIRLRFEAPLPRSDSSITGSLIHRADFARRPVTPYSTLRTLSIRCQQQMSMSAAAAAATR